MKKILVIDRDEETTGTLQQLIESESHKVFVAATMKEIITLLNAETFDIVILSALTATPEFDVVKWLEQHSATTKVILITAAGSAPSPHANVIASFTLPLDCVALEKLIKTNLMENGFFGVLNDISLEDYIQLICMKNATKGIRVSQQNDKGLILIRDGKIMYAAQDNLLGIEAFLRIMSWKKGSFREVKIKLFPQPNIDKDYRSLLLEAAVYEDHARQEAPAEQPGIAKKASAEPADGNKAIATAARERLAEISAKVAKDAAKVTPKASNRNWQPDGQPKQGKRTKKQRMFFALSAIVPVLLLIILLQSFGLTDSLPLPAFATSGPSPVNSKKTTQGPEKTEPATIADKARDAASPSITIGPLHKSGTTAPLPEETILRLHGSNTIGAKLAPALIAEYLTAVLGADKVEQVAGKKENEVFLKARLKDRLLAVEIHAHGSTTGFTDIEAGGCDVAMASRKIKDKEVDTHQALGLGDMTAVTNEHVIALDGIAVIVNKSNKINTLEMPQLTAIFSGQIIDWAEVGGEPGPIGVYARDDNSGTYDTFKHIVLDKLKLKEGSKRFESNPELSEQVSRDPLGIGFTSLPNINKAKAIAIADTGAKPIFPSFFTVATEDYPIARRLYLYTATNPTNRHVRDFIELVHSHRGQEITNKIDMVGMNIKPFYAEKVDYSQIKNLPPVQDYLKATANAQRLSVNFRFNTGKVTLDNRGERDLGRVVDFLKDKLDRQIILAGFADNSGDYEVNQNLAKVRDYCRRAAASPRYCGQSHRQRRRGAAGRQQSLPSRPGEKSPGRSMAQVSSVPSAFKSSDGERRVMELYNRMLAQWPVEHELLEIPTRHGKTFIIASGNHDADRLILLHGAGSNSLMWIDDIERYSKHFRVYAVDLIGEAGKSSANRPAWDSPAYEEWLADIYDSLHIARATIIGISQGGWTALKFATARPARVDRLVLICPGGIVPDRMLFVMYALILSIIGSRGIRRIVKLHFGDQPVPEPVLESMTIHMQHYRHRIGFPPRYSDEELAALTMPIHFIGGSKDVLRDSAKIAERLHRLVPQLSVDLIKGGGHAINDSIRSVLPFLLAETPSDLRN